MVFLVVNLVTQMGVNLVILLLAPAATLSLIIWMGFFLYTPMEILVLLIEMMAFSLLLRSIVSGAVRVMPSWPTCSAGCWVARC